MVDGSNSNGPRPGDEAAAARDGGATGRFAPEHGPLEQEVTPEHFINRELSLLEFNRRVLAQALDESIPLLERLRFLTISSTNLDEFFEVRKASHQERLTLRSSSVGFDGRSTHQLLDDITVEAAELVREQYEVLNDILFPLLAAEGIKVLKRQLWTPEQATWLSGFFGKEVEPILTPVGLDPSHPFPKILNKSLNFIVIVEGEDAFARDTRLGVVQVPRALPRLISLPPSVRGDELAFVLLSSVIHAHVETLFPGMRVVGCHQFRVTRNSELWVDDEEVENILEAIEGELPERKYAEAVRLEVAADCPEKVVRLLRQRFELDDADVYRVNGPVNVGRLDVLHGMVDRPDLKYPPLTPRIPRALARAEDPFAAIRERDILMHHPYESFAPVIDLVRRASSDPDVLAIKQTLYRTERNSAIVAALVAAARNGKQVVAVVELRARFDEAENIDLANQRQEVGAQVVYGIVGHQPHAKMTLIGRREPDGLVRYVHLGTGNYHARTARTYTDLGFLTADPRIAEDVHQVFHRLTGLGATRPLQLLLDAPFTLRQEMRRRIRLEAENARAGQPARIIAKMNALTEVNTIRALYDASAAGVQIDLIVRGACCVRPGIPGISENIRVRSVLGRFLEHSRVFYFEDGGRGAVFASSADWMSRNLYRRVETCFPILDPELKRRAIEEDLLVYLGDQVAAWELQTDGGHARTGGDLDPQQEILRRLGVVGELSDEDTDLPPGEISGLRSTS